MINLPKLFNPKLLFSIAFTAFGLLTLWWVSIYLSGSTEGEINHAFGFVYGGFSLLGAFVGLLAASDWGGRKSVIGRAMLSICGGLFSQAFGQYSFWYINVFKGIEVPYPGIPDIGYFLTIPFYIYAGILLASAAGAKFTLKSFINKVQVIVIPVAMLFVSYTLFLREYEVDLSQPLKVFLDFVYPLGPSIYISLAILTWSLSVRMLGGIMRKPILLLTLAFVAQFVCDFSFIYFQESFYPASFVDFLYLVSYFTMTIGLINLRAIAHTIRKN